MTDFIGLSGTFMLYAVINFVGLILMYFMLFETEGKTLFEIEQHYAGIKHLKEKQSATETKKLFK